jgi:hypothetical protein
LLPAMGPIHNRKTEGIQNACSVAGVSIADGVAAVKEEKWRKLTNFVWIVATKRTVFPTESCMEYTLSPRFIPASPML